MAIRFSSERWRHAMKNASAWWDGALGRPLIQIYVGGQNPGRPEPALPPRPFTSHYDFSVTPGEIVDRWDYNLCCQKFLGDAFPHVMPNFGPGIMAAFLGCSVENRPETTWYHPPSEFDPEDNEFHFDPDNIWLKRVEAVMQEAVHRWDGLVQIDMTDLGGALDVLVSFRSTQRLLLDLHDRPECIEKLIRSLHELWWRYFDRLDAILRAGGNPGYTAWTHLFSETPYYMLQCDLSAMMGPAMFRRFALPELAASCSRLGHAAYHMDGPEQIVHLDMLLEIEELKAIQFVPRVDQRDATHYPDLHRRITEGGKLLQVFGHYSSLGPRLLDRLAKQTGAADRIAMIAWIGPEQEEEARRFLSRYGVESE